MKRKSNVGLLKQHSVLITQFFISLKSRWTELFEDPLELPVYLYQIEIYSELGSHWNSYVYMYEYAKRSRQYSNRSKAAVQVVDMAATIHMVPPTRTSKFFDHRYPCTLFISIKAQMTTMHGDGSTPILRNDCESYLQMCRIKGALLISRYTAGTLVHYVFL